ncbi:hypothetical protein B0H14DRAFT_2604136 [Mycena olivaceomarginata]|nr:hypothetical protein B0H14DRAFT_2604136 [Mycena olivaceomarginata]
MITESLSRYHVGIAHFPRPDDSELGTPASVGNSLLSATSIDSLFLVYREKVLSIPHYDGFKFSCVCSIVSSFPFNDSDLEWDSFFTSLKIANVPASNSSLTAKAKVRMGMVLFTPTNFDFDFSFELRKPKRRLHIIQLVVQNSNTVSDAEYTCQLPLLCLQTLLALRYINKVIQPRLGNGDSRLDEESRSRRVIFKFISSSRIESPKKKSCRATTATRKTLVKPICIQIGIAYGAQQAKRSGLLARIVVEPFRASEGNPQELDGRTNDRRSHGMKRGRERIRWGGHCSA